MVIFTERCSQYLFNWSLGNPSDIQPDLYIPKTPFSLYNFPAQKSSIVSVIYSQDIQAFKQ